MRVSTIANRADPLGFDMRVREDLEPSGRAATGIELAADEMLHRLMADTLSLVGAPGGQVEFGENVRMWIGEALDQNALDTRAPRLEEVLRRSPRLASVTVSLSVAAGDDASRFTFLIHIHATTISGQTIDRIVGVSQVSVEFLAQGR